MKIVLTITPIEKIFSQCSVCFLPEDMRPLKGAVGRVDWALNGLVSRLIGTGKVSGRFLESVLIRPGRYIAGEKLLLFGIGPYEACDAERVVQAGKRLIHVLGGLHVTDISLAPPTPGKGPAPVDFAEFLTKGFLAEGENKDARAFLEKVNFAVSCVAEKIDEILLGIQKAKVDYKRHFSVIVLEE